MGQRGSQHSGPGQYGVGVHCLSPARPSGSCTVSSLIWDIGVLGPGAEPSLLENLAVGPYAG